MDAFIRGIWALTLLRRFILSLILSPCVAIRSHCSAGRCCRPRCFSCLICPLRRGATGPARDAAAAPFVGDVRVASGVRCGDEANRQFSLGRKVAGKHLFPFTYEQQLLSGFAEARKLSGALSIVGSRPRSEKASCLKGGCCDDWFFLTAQWKPPTTWSVFLAEQFLRGFSSEGTPSPFGGSNPFLS